MAKNLEKQEQPEQSDDEQPLVSHLIELRDRLIRCVIVIVVLFVILFSFANDLYELFVLPLTEQMPEGSKMIATSPVSTLLTPLKLALITAIMIAAPYLLHQAWAFIAPGLYKNEIKVAMPILISSILLFYTGIAFAYFVVFKFTFAFMVGWTPDSVQYAPDISETLSFMILVFIAFAICFEIPVAVVLLVLIGVLDPHKLKNMRPYMIVACFTLSMFLTPSDPITLLLMAIPMCLLFELGILAGRVVYRRQEENDDEEEQTT